MAERVRHSTETCQELSDRRLLPERRQRRDEDLRPDIPAERAGGFTMAGPEQPPSAARLPLARYCIGKPAAILAIAASVLAGTAHAQLASLQPLSLEQPFVTRVRAGPGEVAVAMSADGRRVVVGINALRGDVAGAADTIFFSDDGGRTFRPSTFNPRSRDPAVAFGPSGRVYHVSFVGSAAFLLAGSNDGGSSFTALAATPRIGECEADVVSATAPAAIRCGVDQPHMAVDPRPGPSGDRVYVVWRETDTFQIPSAEQPTTIETPMIQASCDGGATVLPAQPIARAVLAPNGLRQSDFLPRVTVGADGKVYAVFVDQRQESPDEILLQRFSACDDPRGFRAEITGLAAGEPGRRVAVFNNIPCGASAQARPAGLDRCNDGNILTGPTVAVDASAPNRIAVTFAHNASPALDEIRVAMSDDRGATFPDAGIVTLHGGGEGRRFLPWSCGGAGQIFVGWYDRRNARATANDLTQYVVRAFQIRPRAPGEAAASMRRFPERDVTQGITDEQCLTWPVAPRSTLDSDSCSAQPQFAGVCTLALPDTNPCPGAACPAGARCRDDRCDFGCNRDAECAGRAGDSAADPLVCEAATCVLTSRQSGVRCDFSDELAAAGPKRCVAGETCQVGSGATKYGDYNGMACSGDSAIVAWASHIPPPGVFEPVGIAVNVARIDARSRPVQLSLCARDPDLCVAPERLIPGGIDLRCDRPACIVIDPIPENCKIKFDCPGCRPGERCPPDYRLILDDPGPAWTVELTDARGVRAPHRRSQAGGRITLTLRPSRRDFIPGAIGEYRLLFRMTDKGEVGKRYHVKMRVDRVSLSTVRIP
jgi:hypothetical protein